MTASIEPGLDILQCGCGHLELRFKPDDVLETEKAKGIVSDMLRRGYALFLEGEDGKMIRVEAFEPTKGVYIIAEGPMPIIVPGGEMMETPKEDIASVVASPEAATAAMDKSAIIGGLKRGRGRPRRAIPMHKVRATVIGRSAGG